MITMFQATVIGLPLSILVSKDTAARLIVLTCIIGAMSLSTLCLIFIPKILALKNAQVLNQQSMHRQQQQQEEQHLNANETIVEEAKITEVKMADVESENTAEENGFLMNIWGGAKVMFFGSDNANENHDHVSDDDDIAVENGHVNVGDDEEFGDNHVMAGKSIFVGRLSSRSRSNQEESVRT